MMKRILPIICILVYQSPLLQAQTINTHPVAASGCHDSDVSFTISATGASSYQWQVLPLGGGWTNLDDTTYPTTGATTNNLIYKISGDMDGFKFRCQVSGAGQVFSDEALLTVQSAPEIVSYTDLRTVCDGISETQFTVEVASGSYSYQWQRFERDGEFYEDLVENAYYSNVDTPTLTITNPDAEMDSSYPILRCVVSFGYCEVLTSEHGAPLYLYGGITFDTQPEDNSCLATGENATISIATNMDWLPGLPYQWQKSDGSEFVDLVDGENYENTNTKDLSILAANSTPEGTYRCVIGTCSDAPISEEATVQFAPDVPQPELADVTGECSVNIPTAPTITSECFGGELTGVADLKGPITEAGTHTLTWTFTDSNEDEHKFTQKLIVTACEEDEQEEVLAIDTSSKLNIYPNPAKGFIHITLNNDASTKVKILTMDGKTTRYMTFTNQHIEISTSDIAPGLYLLWVQNDNREILEKIIIQ